MFEFDRAIAVSKLLSTPTTSTYSAEIFDGWDIFGNANGGYIAAMIVNAMRDHGGRLDPFTITIHYLAPLPPGKVEIEVETVKNGKLSNSMIAKLLLSDPRNPGSKKIGIAAIGAFGEFSNDGPTSINSQPPALPPFESLPIDKRDGAPALMQRLASRLHPDDRGFALGEPSKLGLMRAWFAFADDRPMDNLAAVIAADATAPAVMNLIRVEGWVPTIELTIHFRSRPAGSRLLTSFQTRFVKGGLLEEDGEVWDEAGNLVAISRQIAAMPKG